MRRYPTLYNAHRPHPNIDDRTSGGRGGVHDNAMVQTVIGLFNTEVIRHGGPWLTLEDVECSTLGWVVCFNTYRAMEPIGHLSPAVHQDQIDLLGIDPVPAGALN
jgi:transposase InsO family protein